MLVRKCFMGALVGISAGFILGLVGAFVFGPIWFVASKEGAAPPIGIMPLMLLITIPTGLIIGVMAPIRRASRLRQAAKAEEEAARLRRHKDS